MIPLLPALPSSPRARVSDRCLRGQQTQSLTSIDSDAPDKRVDAPGRIRTCDLSIQSRLLYTPALKTGDAAELRARWRTGGPGQTRTGISELSGQALCPFELRGLWFNSQHVCIDRIKATFIVFTPLQGRPSSSRRLPLGPATR